MLPVKVLLVDIGLRLVVVWGGWWKLSLSTRPNAAKGHNGSLLALAWKSVAGECTTIVA